MNELQAKLLNMLKWLDGFLRENELRYYMVAGTFLGAVRHKGFIPWDDDVDIAMPRADYEKLVELLKKPIDHYVVENMHGGDKYFNYTVGKFYDVNTTLIELRRREIKRGVYIDIFPIDGIGNTLEESHANFKQVSKINALLCTKDCGVRKGRKWWKNLAVYVGRLLPFSAKKLALKFDKVCSSRAFDEYKYVGTLSTTIGTRTIFDRSVYGTPTLYEFEGLSICGPEKAEEYLTQVFGDWRKLPPVDKRCTTHDFIEIDMNKPYGMK